MKALLSILLLVGLIEAFAWGRANRNDFGRLRRRIFWGLAHAVSIVRVRRRVVATSFLICLSASIVLTLVTKPIYRRSVVIYDSDRIQCAKCGTIHLRNSGCFSPYDPW